MANKRNRPRRRSNQRAARRTGRRGIRRNTNDSIKVYATRNFTVTPGTGLTSSIAAASGWLITLAWWMSIAARFLYVAASWTRPGSNEVRTSLTPIGLMKIMPISAADLIIDTPYCFDLAKSTPKDNKGNNVPVNPGRNNLTAWTNFAQARILSLAVTVKCTGDRSKMTGEYAVAICEPSQPEDPHIGPYHEYSAWKDLKFDDISKRRGAVRALASQSRTVRWRPSVVSGSVGLQPLKIQYSETMTDSYNYGHRVVILFAYQTTAFAASPDKSSFDSAIENFSLSVKAVVELAQPGVKRELSAYFYGQNWVPNVSVMEYGQIREIDVEDLVHEDGLLLIKQEPNQEDTTSDFEMLAIRDGQTKTEVDT